MIQKLPAPKAGLTLVDLADRFGPMPLERICFDPWPGTATEQDVIDLHDRDRRLFELIDGILVEKAMGVMESFLAIQIAIFLGNWVMPRNLGAVLGADGMLRMVSAQIRIPDVTFIPWEDFPNRQVPNVAIPTLPPRLAVEVLSRSNTDEEMETKIGEYFQSGARLVWLVDPRAQTAQVFTAPDQSVVLTAQDTLHGGTVLPGFRLPLKDLFATLEPH
jgi:Uma2 family endonuclease